MKLSLIFLVCFISVSLTQRRSYPHQQWPPQSRAPGPYFVLVNPEPVDYDQQDYEYDGVEDSVDQRMNNELQRLSGSNFPSLQQYHHNENVNQYYGAPNVPSHSYAENNYGDISSRQKNRLRPLPVIKRPPALAVPSNARLFFGGFQNVFFPSALYSILSGLSTSIYSTTTTFMLLNSTLVTTLVTSCIPLSQFTVTNNIPQTNSCRRKRGYGNILVEQEDIFDQQFVGLEDEQPMDLDAMTRLRRIDEIESSKEEPNDSRLPSFLRFGRSARYTITSTFTSFSFITVNSTRTIALGNPSQLTCVPSGYRVC